MSAPHKPTTPPPIITTRAMASPFDRADAPPTVRPGADRGSLGLRRPSVERDATMNVATDPWFARTDAGEGVWHVSEPYVDSFARCNIWIVPGSTQVLVVDTGMGLVSL